MRCRLSPVLFLGSRAESGDRKAYLDQLLSDAKVEVKPTAKTWEPLRAYEKKLVSIMHKGVS